ncbi:hypothetical protein [Candidatus Binatus sp.]|uniref:hypothetical protein n=1 Tax=Candidatus Binatus sp. TaxID=2811406 RepID=UPI003BD259B8
MPEESISTPGQNDDALGRLERRIESLEFATQRENRWWRGGLIAALVLVALSILIAGHHRHHHPPPMMGMRGCEGPRMMPYSPPPPPYSGYGPGGGYYGPPEGWHYRQWNGPGREAQPPPPPKG